MSDSPSIRDVYEPGTRVQLVKQYPEHPELDNATGVVVEHRPLNGGYMVQLHGHPGPSGWGYSELKREMLNRFERIDEGLDI